MPYVRGTFSGERARQVARFGSLTTKCVQPVPWRPENICEQVEKIIWRVYLLGEAGEDWRGFTAYDNHGNVLGVRAHKSHPSSQLPSHEAALPFDNFRTRWVSRGNRHIPKHSVRFRGGPAKNPQWASMGRPAPSPAALLGRALCSI
jgi:hypothetical protein